MELKSTLIVAITIGAVCGGASNARAANIVLNGGFEDLTGRETFYNDLTGSLADPSWTPPHWANLSGTEPTLFQTVGSPYGENGVETTLLPPTAGWLPANANGGACALMLQGYGGGYNGTKQDLGAMTVGTTYTVSADFTKNSGGAAINYDFFLMGDDGAITVPLAGIDEVTDGTPGVGWVNKSFSYTAVAGDAGDELWVVLRARVPATDVTRGGVDNVVVNATTIPEPSAIALAGLGLFGLSLRRRR
jgi:hypothetical protein